MLKLIRKLMGLDNEGIEEGYNGDCEYNISRSNILGKFRKMFYRKEDVSSSIEWSGLIGKVITDVKFQFVEQEEKTYLSELELKIADRKITIGSIREPEKDQKLDVEHLEFSTEWSIIILTPNFRTRSLVDILVQNMLLNEEASPQIFC